MPLKESSSSYRRAFAIARRRFFGIVPVHGLGIHSAETNRLRECLEILDSNGYPSEAATGGTVDILREKIVFPFCVLPTKYLQAGDIEFGSRPFAFDCGWLETRTADNGPVRHR
jgi:hypothetical protein